MEIFSKRLRELREQRRLSRKVASELCGFYEHAFRRYERGEAIPSAESWRMSSGSPWITCGAELKNNF